MTWPPPSTPRGHPMEPGPPTFPGPLYPPDAAPAYTPSTPGPLALACKRFAAHLGAWPWEPDEWDEAYSNAFAHGSSRGAGMAGVQKWARIAPATGYFGTASYNFARSVLIPQGRTHAGEPAWDAVCQSLAEQAYDLQRQDGLVDASGAPDVRLAALELAESELGVHEDPPGSNVCLYSEWYGMTGPWCAMFVTWCFTLAVPGFASHSFDRYAGRYAYVPYIVADARGARYGLSVTSSPIPGDLVCYDWQGDGEYDHVGIFETWIEPGSSFEAIEGNTSPANDSNGGEVMRRSRNVNGQATTFVRVAQG